MTAATAPGRSESSAFSRRRISTVGTWSMPAVRGLRRSVGDSTRVELTMLITVVLSVADMVAVRKSFCNLTCRPRVYFQHPLRPVGS